jgi:hypothetical protein
MNSKPTIQFDGSNDYLLLANGEPTSTNGISLRSLSYLSPMIPPIGEELSEM